jgi:8-oxo-dGTP pyrophosphatase MutT (NUDIX family)
MTTDLMQPEPEEAFRGPDLLRRMAHLYFRLSRPMTLGVRAAILDEERGVFLVRHGYVSGWQMPGGGVEAGETLLEALAREVIEETNIEITGAPRLHGVFLNRFMSRRDHVAVYVARSFRVGPPKPPNREIQEGRFFRLDALPEEITRGTRARLAEIAGERDPSPYW